MRFHIGTRAASGGGLRGAVRVAAMLAASVALPVTAMTTLCLHGQEGHVELLGFCHGAGASPDRSDASLHLSGPLHEPHPGFAFEAGGHAGSPTPPAAVSILPLPETRASATLESGAWRPAARGRGTGLLNLFLRL